MSTESAAPRFSWNAAVKAPRNYFYNQGFPLFDTEPIPREREISPEYNEMNFTEIVHRPAAEAVCPLATFSAPICANRLALALFVALVLGTDNHNLAVSFDNFAFIAHRLY